MLLCLYVFLLYCFHHLRRLCSDFMDYLLWLAVGLRSLSGGLFTILLISVLFDNTAFAVSEDIEILFIKPV